jgi:hypothetical protein
MGSEAEQKSKTEGGKISHKVRDTSFREGRKNVFSLECSQPSPARPSDRSKHFKTYERWIEAGVAEFRLFQLQLNYNILRNNLVAFTVS